MALGEIRSADWQSGPIFYSLADVTHIENGRSVYNKILNNKDTIISRETATRL